MAMRFLILPLGLAYGQCLYENKDAMMDCVPGCSKAGSSTKQMANASCLSSCVQLKQRGVSQSCALCLGEGVACAVKSCQSSCYPGRENFFAVQCSKCLEQQKCKTCSDTPVSNETRGAYALLAELAFKTSSEDTATRGFCFEDQAKLKKCGTECSDAAPRARARCVSRCLRLEGMQPACASCFGDKVDCTIQDRIVSSLTEGF
eukprot:symbB.v1.2.019749.t1/scaffold1630.1/size108773/2